MSFVKSQKSDRFQAIIAVLFMSLIAASVLTIAVAKDNIMGFFCNYVGFAEICPNLPPAPAPAGSSQIVASKINSACVDADGLKISVGFDVPLTGEANIQVFSTGPDFFPSGQGMTDTYEVRATLTAATDHLDFIIPVDSMPVGEQIFGNIVSEEEGHYSHVAYFINVSDCSTTNALPPNLTPTSSLNDIPIIHSATCLPSQQLMIAFEFQKPVPGQYQVLVADIPYQLASVVNQPAILFFSGEAPPEGSIIIRLVSATDQEILFEETYTPPVCGAT